MAGLTRRGLLEIAGIGGGTLIASSLRASASEGDGAPADGATGAGDERIETRLTRDYGLRHPFVGAGMAFVAIPELVAAVSNAGGLGVFGNGPTPPPLIGPAIRAIKALTSRPFGIDFINAVTPLGPFVTADHVAVAAAERVPVVVFFWAPPAQDWVNTLHGAGSKVWMQIGSVSEALAAAAAGVDALVCQGTEAGGHNKSQQPRAELVRDVRAAVGPQMLLLAAGGIADGRGAARALAAGAEGVWVGTRLVASREAYAAAEYKRRLVQATDGDTVIQRIFGPEWPGQPQRVLRNRVVAEWAGREAQIPNPPPPPAQIGTTSLFGQTYPMPKFSAIVPTPDTSGDFEEMDMPAGEGVGLIDEVKPAGAIVAEMMSEAARLLREK
jgi:NAD(P)H-dependent flavin oxidoreductase YrpB (nitropropane dioxygenase family)